MQEHNIQKNVLLLCIDDWNDLQGQLVGNLCVSKIYFDGNLLWHLIEHNLVLIDELNLTRQWFVKNTQIPFRNFTLSSFSSNFIECFYFLIFNHLLFLNEKLQEWIKTKWIGCIESIIFLCFNDCNLKSQKSLKLVIWEINSSHKNYENDNHGNGHVMDDCNF